MSLPTRENIHIPNRFIKVPFHSSFFFFFILVDAKVCWVPSLPQLMKRIAVVGFSKRFCKFAYAYISYFIGFVHSLFALIFNKIQFDPISHSQQQKKTYIIYFFVVLFLSVSMTSLCIRVSSAEWKRDRNAVNGKMTLQKHKILVRLYEHYSSISWMMYTEQR